MRRVLGRVLLGLGVFLLVLGVLSRSFMYSRLLVVPANQYAVSIAPGPGTYFDASTLKEVTTPMVARRVLRADVPASTNKIGVWDVSLVVSTSAGSLVQAYTDRVAFKRDSGISVNCCGEGYDGASVKHEGYTYKFPFNTKKQTYTVTDPSAQKAFPAVYSGTSKIQGLTVYKFVQNEPPFHLKDQQTPASLVGGTGNANVNAPVWYTDLRTIYVEPATGVIISGNEQQLITLRDVTGTTDKVIVLKDNFTFDTATQKSQAKLAKDSRTKITLVKWGLPVGGVVLGLILIGLGLWLARPRDEDEGSAAGELDPEPVGAAN
jgi:hypothetical protein